MPEAWRIVREKHLHTAFSGMGAAKFGGRWNLPDTRVAYASGTLSLAALELIVHLNPPAVFKYKAIRFEFPADLVEALSWVDLPRDWAAEPPSQSTQRIGSRWAAEGRSAILAVPSVLIESEINYVVNPIHADFGKIRMEPARDFALDKRLVPLVP